MLHTWQRRCLKKIKNCIDGFVRLWLGAWGLSWLVAFPLLFVALPLARAFTRFWVEDPP